MVWNRPWTETERAHIEAHYSAVKSQRLEELISGRTEHAIRNKASRMGVKKSPERLRELGENFGAKRVIET